MSSSKIVIIVLLFWFSSYLYIDIFISKKKKKKKKSWPTFDQSPTVLAVFDLWRNTQARLVIGYTCETVTIDDVEIIAVRYTAVDNFRVYDVNTAWLTVCTEPSLQKKISVYVLRYSKEEVHDKILMYMYDRMGPLSEGEKNNKFLQ